MSEKVTKTNSMTLVDRLALRIKESDVGVFLTEDELIEIGGEAVRKAFFEPQKIPSSAYGSTFSPKDPLIVELAREAFRPILQKRVQEMVENLSKQPEFSQAIQEVAISSIPALLLTYGRRLAGETVRFNAEDTINAVLERIRNGQMSPGYKDPRAPEDAIGVDMHTDVPPLEY